MGTFIELFNTILTADKEASRQAAREARKFLYSSHSSGQFQDITLIIESAPSEYVKIAEDWRQENFVIAVSVLYYLHDRESQPDFLFSWLFHLLQHKNGNIRYSAVNMFDHEFGSLTHHIRFPNERSDYNKLSPKLADYIIYGIYTDLNNLLVDLWKPVYKKYKYISSLPSEPYKSIQMVIDNLEYDCGKEYVKCMEESLHSTTNFETFTL
ncbi:MAG: hypothetical protein V1905_03435 [bacterium]